MINLMIPILLGTILLVVSLNLEAQTTHKGSVEYKSLKKWGGTGCVMAWVGFIALLIISSL